MTKLEMLWPDAGEERIRSARGKLDVAGEWLRGLDFDDRLRRLTRVLTSWTAPDSPWRRELCESLAARSSLDRRTLEEGIESALRAWDPAVFEACAQREIGSIHRSGRARLAPFDCVSVLSGGAIPMPTLSGALFPLVLGSAVLLRETSRDSTTGALFVRSLAEVDPDLARCLEIVRFPSEDENAMRAFLDSACVVATGSDETIESIRSRLSVSQRFVAYGHRFSIAVFGPEATRTGAALERAAEGLAIDIARWDQAGCLSPVVSYVVGLSIPDRHEVAQHIATALESLTPSFPRGVLSPEERALQATERAEARMRAAVSDAAHSFEGTDSTVILETDAQARPAPLARFLRVLPVESIAELGRGLTPFSRHLSSAAVMGFCEGDDSLLRGALSRAGINRITEPGRLQTPPIDWPHDGQPVFLPMARFVQG